MLVSPNGKILLSLIPLRYEGYATVLVAVFVARLRPPGVDASRPLRPRLGLRGPPVVPAAARPVGGPARGVPAGRVGRAPPTQAPARAAKTAPCRRPDTRDAALGQEMGPCPARRQVPVPSGLVGPVDDAGRQSEEGVPEGAEVGRRPRPGVVTPLLLVDVDARVPVDVDGVPVTPQAETPARPAVARPFATRHAVVHGGHDKVPCRPQNAVCLACHSQLEAVRVLGRGRTLGSRGFSKNVKSLATGRPVARKNEQEKTSLYSQHRVTLAKNALTI